MSWSTHTISEYTVRNSFESGRVALLTLEVTSLIEPGDWLVLSDGANQGLLVWAQTESGERSLTVLTDAHYRVLDSYPMSDGYSTCVLAEHHPVTLETEYTLPVLYVSGDMDYESDYHQIGGL